MALQSSQVSRCNQLSALAESRWAWAVVELSTSWSQGLAHRRNSFEPVSHYESQSHRGVSQISVRPQRLLACSIQRDIHALCGWKFFYNIHRWDGGRLDFMCCRAFCRRAPALAATRRYESPLVVQEPHSCSLAQSAWCRPRYLEYCSCQGRWSISAGSPPLSVFPAQN